MGPFFLQKLIWTFLSHRCTYKTRFFQVLHQDLQPTNENFYTSHLLLSSIFKIHFVKYKVQYFNLLANFSCYWAFFKACAHIVLYCALQHQYHNTYCIGSEPAIHSPTDKCEILCIMNKKCPNQQDYFIHGLKLATKSDAKYLGVTIWSDLLWSKHAALEHL